jgi:hypothetical protein
MSLVPSAVAKTLVFQMVIALLEREQQQANPQLTQARHVEWVKSKPLLLLFGEMYIIAASPNHLDQHILVGKKPL